MQTRKLKLIFSFKHRLHRRCLSPEDKTLVFNKRITYLLIKKLNYFIGLNFLFNNTL